MVNCGGEENKTLCTYLTYVVRFINNLELSFEANFGAMTSHFEATFDAILTPFWSRLQALLTRMIPSTHPGPRAPRSRAFPPFSPLLVSPSWEPFQVP